jgi:cytochrome c biogenesis protein CcdA
MWKSRLAGVVIAAVGASVLGFLWSQMMDQSNDYLLIYRIGIPGDLILSALGLMAIVFGLHLLFAPRTAVRAWTPRITRKT